MVVVYTLVVTGRLIPLALHAVNNKETLVDEETKCKEIHQQ